MSRGQKAKEFRCQEVKYSGNKKVRRSRDQDVNRSRCQDNKRSKGQDIEDKRSSAPTLFEDIDGFDKGGDELLAGGQLYLLPDDAAQYSGQDEVHRVPTTSNVDLASQMRPYLYRIEIWEFDH